MEGIITEIPDKDRVYSTDKDTCIGKSCGNRFIVPAGVLHTDLGFTIKALKLLDQTVYGRLGVGDITGWHNDHVSRSLYSDSAFSFGNINTNSVHNRYSFEK